jgi:flavin-dependent dehydrogenase
MAAVEQGTELRDVNPLVGFEEKDDRVVVRTRCGLLETKFLVGADGATGRVKGFVGNRYPSCAALEVEIKSREIRKEELTLVHLTLIRDGYAWVFPKAGIHSVGILSFNRDRRNVKEKLAEWLNACGYSLDGNAIHGHPIPIWRKKIPLATKRVLLVGDAAATVDPLVGEGIRYGILSGRIAASYIREAVACGFIPAGYTGAVYEAIHADFKYAGWLAYFIYRFPGFCFNMAAQRPRVTEWMGKVFYGELRYRDLFHMALRALSRPQSYLGLLGKTFLQR